jgi:hypothetical protein
MAIVSVSEMRGRSGGNNVKLEGTRRARFRVKTNSLTHGPEDIYLAAGIPGWWAADPEGGGRFVQDKSAEQNEENPYYWIVTVEYAIPPEGEDGEDPPDPENPETRRPIWFRGTWKFTKNTIYDKDNNLIVNTAGAPFTEGLDLEQGGLMYRYTFWSTTSGDGAGSGIWGTHLFKVNNATWKDHTARKALLTDIQAEEERINGTLYYKRTYEVLINEDTWDERLLNRGFSDLSTGLLVHIKDDRGKPITEPWWLDADGEAIRPQPTAPTFAEPYIRIIQVRGLATFSDLW